MLKIPKKKLLDEVFKKLKNKKKNSAKKLRQEKAKREKYSNHSSEQAHRHTV